MTREEYFITNLVRNTILSMSVNNFEKWYLISYYFNHMQDYIYISHCNADFLSGIYNKI